MKDEKKQAEMEARGLVVSIETSKSSKDGEEGFVSSIALRNVSTEEAIQIIAEALFGAAEKMATNEKGHLEPFELLKVEMTLHKVQKAHQKRMIQKMDDQMPPTRGDMDILGLLNQGPGDLSSLIKGLGLAMKMKRDLGI